MNLTLPCVDDRGNSLILSTDEISCIVLHKKKILVFTCNGIVTSRLFGSIDTFEEWFERYGLGFERLDSGNLVNMKKIIGKDSENRIAFFDKMLQTTISVRNLSKVAHIKEIKQTPRR
ncbi:hypothetical protein [Paenibacillus tianmuensis]|uniref:hypothetical protein n=1 Tax=Paenibacillus tianmuensis TaxID=624147 RepID=UPI000B8449A4|nr:hypothetical protein [Paenibacillus tianmuensis]